MWLVMICVCAPISSHTGCGMHLEVHIKFIVNIRENQEQESGVTGHSWGGGILRIQIICPLQWVSLNQNLESDLFGYSNRVKCGHLYV